MSNEKVCRKCGSTKNAKWGKRKGKQAYRCSVCGFQFTRENERKSEKDTLRVVALFCCGFSYCTIGKILSYHNTTILKRVKEFSNDKKGSIISRKKIILELDEIKDFIVSKKEKLKLSQRESVQVDAFLRGECNIQIPESVYNRISD